MGFASSIANSRRNRSLPGSGGHRQTVRMIIRFGWSPFVKPDKGAWPATLETVIAMARTAHIQRKTNETQIDVTINLDGTGTSSIETGVGFFDHMLEQVSKHALIDIDLKADGDLYIDDHHTVEDCGWALGQAVHEALGDRKGITRYASIRLPMDETLTEAAIDVSGRPFLVWSVAFTADKIGQFDTELVREFFQAFSQAARITLHIENLYGSNSHHIAESAFKAVARSLRSAIAVDPRQSDSVPSTKGSLNV